MIRYQEQEKKRIEELENEWAVGREILAMLFNANRGKGQAAKTGTEFIKLSIDNKKKKEAPRLTPEQVEKKFPKRLKGKIK